MSRIFLSASLLALLAAGVATAADVQGLGETGKPDLKSAGPLAFGPKGVLFVADPQGAAVFAIGVGEAPKAALAGDFKLEGVDGKVAALLGTTAADISINDLAVEPGTGIAYLSVSRGKGNDAEPAIVRVDGAGQVTALPLDKVQYSKVEIANAPSTEAKDRKGGSLRLESITDLAFVDGKLFIAGLSNEEFASKLRSIPFPFTTADTGTSVEILHAAHGAAFETRSPVRTFVPLVVGGEPQLLAAYTCTPLVTFPISSLKAGEKVRGKTVAELGNRNRPLDMVVYEKDGKQYVLLANHARGIMKIPTDGLAEQPALTEAVRDGNTAGLKYETIKELQGVDQLDKLGDKSVLLLVKGDDVLNLKAVALP
ncbi:MAG: hypothetical protein WD872_09685 [Pirellulaceae bacterium]